MKHGLETLSEHLRRELHKRCEKNPRYSLRAFARFLEIDEHGATSNTMVDASFTDDWYWMHWVASAHYPDNKLFKDVVDAYPKLAEELMVYYNQLMSTRLELESN
jgi:hypothetical protein